MKRPDASTDCPRYENAEKIGEDPYKFLRQGVDVAVSRIEGVMRFDRLEAYVECEEKFGPRKRVIAAIYQRKAELEEMDHQEQLADLMTRSVAADGGVDDV